MSGNCASTALVLGLALVLAGCSGDDGQEPIVPPAGDDDDDTEPPPVDTAPEGGFIDAAGFVVVARFGYDPDLGLHVPFAEPGEGLTPLSLSVVLLDSAVLIEGGADETTSCSVTLDVPGTAPMADWVEPASAWTGFDVPTGAAVRDTCRFYGLPGSFARDAGGHVAKWSWSVGVGPLDPEVAEQLRVTLPASEWASLEPFLVGGALKTDAVSGGTDTTGGDAYIDQGIGRAYEVDGNFEIVAGGTGSYRPIPKADVEIDDLPGVARAYYEVQLGPFGPGEALTRDPGGY